MERVAIEMAARLPQMRPDRYRVLTPPRALAYKLGHAWEQAVLPIAARGARLIYCPANLAPVASRRSVVVMHDVVALRHPEWYGRFYARYQRVVFPILARRSRGLITVSEFSRSEIVDRLDVPADRVSVVPPGVSESFSPTADPEPVRRAHGLERPYVLVVGTRIARKNLAALSEAGGRLAEEGLELVTAGSGRSYMRAEADRWARPLGYVPDDQLPGLYAGASALAMPSLYEGFGLPCLEAMASGVPVVAANRGALPEVCGDAALLVDPEDAARLADSLLTAAAPGPVRDRLVSAGRERAARFTWERTAELTDGVIDRLLGAG